MPRARAALWISAVALQLIAGCGKPKPATRDEALDACNRGCLDVALERLRNNQLGRTYCTENCNCLIGARFDPSGKQRKSTPEEFQRQIEGCAASANAKIGDALQQ